MPALRQHMWDTLLVIEVADVLIDHCRVSSWMARFLRIGRNIIGNHNDPVLSQTWRPRRSSIGFTRRGRGIMDRSKIVQTTTSPTATDGCPAAAQSVFLQEFPLKNHV